MSFNFKQVAQQELSLSSLMSGRTQITTEEILDNPVHIIAFDFATITDEHNEEKTFPVIWFEEYPDRYYNGGSLLNKLCTAWATGFEGDVEEASNALQEAGGVLVKFTRTRTKRGNTLTAVEVL